jgi:hypothetical protein
MALMSACGRFCCRSRLREASKRDSVVLTRIAAKSTCVVDLMDALRKSIGSGTAETKTTKKAIKKPRKAAVGQKEMLMPIESKKSKEATAKKPAAKPQRKSA